MLVNRVLIIWREKMKTYKLCYDLLKQDYNDVNYTYKDGHYHTRLIAAGARSAVVGFEMKLAFVTSLAFAHYLSVNPIKVEDINDWEKLIKDFSMSIEYCEIMESLNEIPHISKGLKILKPYSKKAKISILDLMHSYKIFLTDNLVDYSFHLTFSNIFGCSISDFLKYDDTELIVSDVADVDINKFQSKHKNIGSLWD